METEQPHTTNTLAWRAMVVLSSLVLLGKMLGLVWMVLALLGAAWSLVLILFALLVAAHVAGNAIGTRLRDSESLRSDQPLPPGAVPVGVDLAAWARTSVPRLSQRRRLSRLVAALIAAGAVSGALLAPSVLFQAPQAPRQPMEYVIGVASFAVLGGLAGFLAGSFFVVAVWPCVGFFFRRASDRPCLASDARRWDTGG